MMIWLPDLPGAGLLPKISSTFAQVLAQSYFRRLRVTGTILAKIHSCGKNYHGAQALKSF